MATLNNNTDWKNISRTNPFDVPDSYFENLSRQVADRIAAPHRGQEVWAALWQVARPLMAAAVVLLGCFFAFSHASDSRTEQNQYMAQASSGQVVDRLLYMNDLADVMASDDFFSEADADEFEGALSDEEMMYYLMNAGVDMGDVISMMYYDE